MFDFTSLFHAVNASRIVERHGKQILMALVGDSLLEVNESERTVGSTSLSIAFLFRYRVSGRRVPVLVSVS